MIYETRAACSHLIAWRADSGTFKACELYQRHLERLPCWECRLDSIEAEHKSTLDGWRCMMEADAKKIRALELRIIDLELRQGSGP